MSINIDTLARELDTTGDIGATANAMAGYLGHLTHDQALAELGADDEALLRSVQW